MRALNDDEDDNNYKSHDWSRAKNDDFDTDLAHRAELFSEKWAELFENSAQNDGDTLNGMLKTTAIGGHNINRFDPKNSVDHRLNLHPGSIIDQNKLILLDQKYFAFETSTETGVTHAISNRNADYIESYTTVIDQIDDPIETALNSKELPAVVHFNETISPTKASSADQAKAQIKPNKKKKGRTKYRPLPCEEASSSTLTGTNARALGAPPGVRTFASPLTSSRRMDLSKGGNCSLQFRL